MSGIVTMNHLYLRILEAARRHLNPKHWPLIARSCNYPASPQTMFSSVWGAMEEGSGACTEYEGKLSSFKSGTRYIRARKGDKLDQ